MYRGESEATAWWLVFGLASLWVELYSPETLAHRQAAFDGTVESINTRW
jgi:hypothetical protein